MLSERYNSIGNASATRVPPNERVAGATARQRALHEGPVFRFRGATESVTGVATQKIIDSIRIDLRNLLHEEDEDGYIFKPSKYAFLTAWNLISDAYLEMGDDLPRPFVSPDGGGGIRIEWSINDCVVSLVIPALRENQGYIYRRTCDNHGADRDISSGALITSLRWLIDDERRAEQHPHHR